ncbi:MAG: hypothetical protein R3B07_06580 [Polyangiaceae bacterium]
MSQSKARADAKSRLERSLALKAFPPFAELDERVLSALAGHAELKRLNSGEPLGATAPMPRALRLVVSGCLKDGAGVRYGKHQLVGGPQALAFEGQLDSATRAESDTVVLEFEDRVLEALFEDEFSALEAMLRGLARSLLKRDGAEQPILRAPQSGAMGLVERVQVLRACPGLGALGLDILADIGLEGELQPLASGEMWQRQGESYAALLSGKLVDVGGRGLTAPSLLGWLAALGEKSTRARYVAQLPSVLMVFDAERFWDCLEDHPDQGVELVRSLSRLLA